MLPDLIFPDSKEMPLVGNQDLNKGKGLRYCEAFWDSLYRSLVSPLPRTPQGNEFPQKDEYYPDDINFMI
jgi:hypothetical protein